MNDLTETYSSCCSLLTMTASCVVRHASLMPCKSHVRYRYATGVSLSSSKGFSDFIFFRLPYSSWMREGFKYGSPVSLAGMAMAIYVQGGRTDDRLCKRKAWSTKVASRAKLRGALCESPSSLGGWKAVSSTVM